MATTEPFQSKYRRENRTSGTRERRRVFEADGTEREPRTSSGVSVSVGSRYGRDRNSNDRTDTSTVTQKVNRLSLKDDKEDSDKEEENAAKKNHDDDAEEEQQKKTNKKDRGGASANSARKRQARKNLREKRRSTGVVIMPGQPVVPGDDEEQLVSENTARNIDSGKSNTQDSAVSNNDSSDNGELLKKIESYEQAIEDWKDELAKAKKEIESLRNDNQRLKDENSALLRVVGSLSGTGRK